VQTAIASPRAGRSANQPGRLNPQGANTQSGGAVAPAALGAERWFERLPQALGAGTAKAHQMEKTIAMRTVKTSRERFST